MPQPPSHRRKSRQPDRLRNVGPVTASWLRRAGILTREDLAAVGAVEAWYRLRFLEGRQVTLNALFALEGAILDVDWRMLPEVRKAELRQAAAARPPG